MTTPLWITPAGNLPTAYENVLYEFHLRVQNDLGTVFLTVSGDMPPGIALLPNGMLYGTVIAAGDNVSFTFTVRAQNSFGITDRTFCIARFAESLPQWVTPNGVLPIGRYQQEYIVNYEPINYQLVATHDILPDGQKLRYYLEDLTITTNPVLQHSGLPNGIVLTEDGLITGIVDDSLTIPIAIGLDTDPTESGAFDSEVFDRYPLDHLDNPPGTPFPKIYEFIVSVTDGNVKASRRFFITVNAAVNFQASTSFITADSEVHTSDISSSNIPPYWLTPVELEPIRSNNKVSIAFSLYDPYSYLGIPTYSHNIVEPQITAQTGLLGSSEYNNYKNSQYFIIRSPSSPVPPNLYFQLEWQTPLKSPTMYKILSVSEYNTGIALQLGIDTKFKKTVYSMPVDEAELSAYLPGDMIFDKTSNLYYVFTNKFTSVGSSPVPYIEYTLEDDVQNNQTVFIGPISKLPLNFELDRASGVLLGSIPFQPMYDMNYKFIIGITKRHPVTLDVINRIYRYFTLFVKSEYEIEPAFVSQSDLGTYHTNTESQITISTPTEVYSIYKIVSGALPAGMTLTQDGLIIGSAIQVPPLSYTGNWQPTHVYRPKDCFKFQDTFYQVNQTFTSGSTFSSSIYISPLEFDSNGVDLKYISTEYRFSVQHITQNRILTHSDGISEIVVVSGGDGYPADLFATVSAPDSPSGRRALLKCSVVDSVLTKIEVVDHGSGYIYSPSITFSSVPTTTAIVYPIITKTLDPKFVKEFRINILCHPFKQFTKIYASPLMPRAVSIMLKNMLADSNVVEPYMLYRPTDPAFGIQSNLKMNIEYGIEQIALPSYYSNLSEYFYNKQMRVNTIKVLNAYDSYNNPVYDLIYLDVLDPMINSSGQSIPQAVTFSNTTVYPNSITNIKSYLESIQIMDSDILVDESMQPDFVNTLQLRTAYNFIMAIPLIYTLPSYGAIVASRIHAYNFNFNSINFVIDRLITDIDLQTGTTQYIRFDDR